MVLTDHQDHLVLQALTHQRVTLLLVPGLDQMVSLVLPDQETMLQVMRRPLLNQCLCETVTTQESRSVRLEQLPLLLRQQQQLYLTQVASKKV